MTLENIAKSIEDEDIFVLPLDNNQYLLYLPLYRACCICNKEFILDIDEKKLATLGLVKSQIEKSGFKEKSNIFNIDLTVCNTYNCNLHCLYCYAGDYRSKKKIDLKIVRNCVDYLIKEFPNYEIFNLNFHGGGEPFVAFDIMKSIVNYVKSVAKKIHISSATNGVLNQNQIYWVIKNNVHLTISFDGNPEVQNYHRPLRNGGPSHEYVINTIKTLEKNKREINIRSTITDFSVGKMEEITEYFISHGAHSIHLEPMYAVGFGKNSVVKPPDALDFAQNFIRCNELAEKDSVEIFCSLFHFNMERNREFFCDMPSAGKNSLCLTTDGFLTGCLEVTNKQDPGSDLMYKGYYDKKTEQFLFFEDRIKFLKNLHINQWPVCKNCFAKYDCLGNCLMKNFRTYGSLTINSSDTENQRCSIMRHLLKYQLLRYASGEPKGLKNKNSNNIKILIEEKTLMQP